METVSIEPKIEKDVATSNKKKFVLAIDGGGVRSVMQWKILQRLLKQFPNLLDEVDVFAGTSAGAILASALACDMVDSIDNMLSQKNLTSIFNRTFCHKVSSLGGITKARYENRRLRQLIEGQFGTLKLHDLKRSLFMPAFAVNGNDWLEAEDEHIDQKEKEWKEVNDVLVKSRGDDTVVVATPDNQHLVKKNAPSWFHMRCPRWHSVFYHNLTPLCQSDNHVKDADKGKEEAEHKDTMKDESKTKERHHVKQTHDLISESILRSAAAPYYFPMVGNCVDGGLNNNNPSLAIISHLLTLGTPLEDIYVLSLGSGETPRSLNVKDNSSLGLVNYLSSFINMVFDANSEVLSQSSYAILQDRYCRVNPVVSPEIALDETTSFDRLIYLAETCDLTSAINWIEKNITPRQQ
jgi:patatin-like phospholipase/acyl hydrolase